MYYMMCWYIFQISSHFGRKTYYMMSWYIFQIFSHFGSRMYYTIIQYVFLIFSQLSKEMYYTAIQYIFQILSQFGKRNYSFPPFCIDPITIKSLLSILFSSNVASQCISLVPTLIIIFCLSCAYCFLYFSSDLGNEPLRIVLQNHSSTFSVFFTSCTSVLPVFRCFTSIYIHFLLAFFLVLSLCRFWSWLLLPSMLTFPLPHDIHECWLVPYWLSSSMMTVLGFTSCSYLSNLAMSLYIKVFIV